jgi:23S rRNA pseudouridine2605 synthase
MERLQKVIAQSNIASRRKAEVLISEGKVKVNGIVVKELGVKVNKNDEIEVEGVLIKKAPKKVYLLMNKPTGYLVTNSDEKNRKTIIELINEEYDGFRIYPIGRLDIDTSGLVLLTNDGELTNLLTKKEQQIDEEYIVRVSGVIVRKKLIEIRKGVTIRKKYLMKAKEINLIEIDKNTQTTLLRVVVNDETRNRNIKLMFEEAGFPVKTLTRTGFGFLNLEGVIRGGYRELKVHEVKKLFALK